MKIAGVLKHFILVTCALGEFILIIVIIFAYNWFYLNRSNSITEAAINAVAEEYGIDISGKNLKKVKACLKEKGRNNEAMETFLDDLKQYPQLDKFSVISENVNICVWAVIKYTQEGKKLLAVLREEQVKPESLEKKEKMEK